MTAIEKKKFFACFRYVVYTVIFFLFYVLQNTPSLFSVRGIKPILLIPAAVVFAMYEGEFIGGIFGALAGMLCDMGGFFLFGFDAILTLVFSAVSGLFTSLAGTLETHSCWCCFLCRSDAASLIFLCTRFGIMKGLPLSFGIILCG